MRKVRGGQIWYNLKLDNLCYINYQLFRVACIYSGNDMVSYAVNELIVNNYVYIGEL